MTVCRQCGESNPERFRLCGMCGAPLAVPVAPREVRKTVTIVFSDLKGSTSLGERLDTESFRDALSFYFAEMQAVLQRHGGTVEKYIGDAIMAVFGLPSVREDDALRAVRAAYEMQRRLGEINGELRRRWGIELENRTGVNTGEVVAGDAGTGQRLATGDTVNTAARLEQAAGACQILLGQLTYELVRDAAEVEPVEPLELKGKAESVPAYRLVSVAGAAATSRRLEAPLVGRTDELARIHASLRAAENARAARLVTVVGAAGVGKSRLIQEFLASLEGRGQSLRGRCLSYGDGITFWPLVEMIRSAAAIEDEVPAELAVQRLTTLCDGNLQVADRLASLLGLSTDQHPLEETFWAARTLFESLAGSGAAVVVIDDIHWAEPTLLDLIEHALETAAAPILFVCSARVDLFDERPTWGDLNGAERLDLDPLTGPETEAVVANILGQSGLPAVLMDRIGVAAEGNPLFIEQMLSMLVDSGGLRRSDDGEWQVTSDVSRIRVPPSIAALIAARIDRLGIEDRTVLQEGSVIGQVFYRGAVREISPPELKPTVDRALGRLTDRQLVRPDPTAFMDEDAFRFDHALIHDSAYRSLLKRERAELHERVAVWLETVAAQRVAELEEIIGYHLEQSALHLRELGPLHSHGRELADRAAERLSSAGRRASARGDSPAAANLLQRATSLMVPGSRSRIELELDLSETYANLGDFEQSEAVVETALTAALALGDEILATNAALVQLFLRYTLDPQDRTDEVLHRSEAAILLLEQAGDHRGLVRAWRLIGWVYGTACQYGAAEQAVERAVEHARLAGDRRAETRNLMSFAVSALYGPMRVGDAIELAERISVEVQGDRQAEGVVLCASAHLHALRGDIVEARTLYRRARQVLEELGGKVMAATVSLDSGRVELLAGDPLLAEDELRQDYDALEAVGERYTLSTVAGLLAEALLRQGRLDEAFELTRSAEDLSAEDDVESQCLWRRVRAAILARRGDAAAALQLAEASFALIADTDAPLLKGATLVDVGVIKTAAGRPDEARHSWRTALDLFEAKGASLPAAGIRERLEAQLG